MDRLTKLTAATGLLLLLAPASLAQTYTTDSYVMAGDVYQPDIYEFEGGSAVTVGRLLEHAHPAASEGKIFILRGTPRIAEAIESVAVLQDEILQPGDVVIFKSDTQVQMKHHHAVVLANSAATILSYQSFSSYSFQMLSRKSPELTALESGSVIVNRPATEQRGELQVEEPVMHGDVIELPTQDVQPTVATKSLSLPPTPDMSADAFGDPSQAMAMAKPVTMTQVQSSTNGGQFSLSIPNNAPSATNSLSSEASQVVLPENPSFDDFIPTADDVPLAPFEKPQTQTAESVDQSFLAVNDDSQTAHRQGDKDLAGKEAASDTQDSSAWNGLLLLGFVFAIGLILVGWIKTQQDREEDQLRADSIKNSISGAVEATSAETTQISHAETPMATHLPPANPETAIEQEIRAEAVSEDCPVLSAGLYDSESSKSESTLATSSCSTCEQCESHESQSSFATQAEAPRMAANNVAASTTENSEMHTTHASGIDDTEIDWERQGELTAKSRSQQDLNQLLENRLPVELQQAQLPKHVILYGKPAGPQKIRVDMAHSQIAAPHMVRQNREARTAEPIAASNTKNQNRQQQSANRFDSALHTLNEQDES